MMEISFY